MVMWMNPGQCNVECDYYYHVLNSRILKKTTNFYSYPNSFLSPLPSVQLGIAEINYCPGCKGYSATSKHHPCSDSEVGRHHSI